MLPSTRISCPCCGREQAETRRLCELCGQPLAEALREAATGLMQGALDGAESAPRAPNAGGLPREFRALRPPPRERPSLKEPITYLALGIPLALAFSLTPLLGFMGWFLSSLFHEAGHSAVAWFTGHPSVPAISLSGHAAAVHGEALWFLRLVMVGSAITLSVQFLDGRRRFGALGALVVGYPLLIWTPVGEMLFLVSGHFGELAAASLCLWRAADGQSCHHRLERAAYAMLGWFLCGTNIVLSFGLAFSASARAEYASNGSFGLTNDYIRLAEESIGTSLAQVGFGMGVLALAVPIATLALYARTHPGA